MNRKVDLHNDVELPLDLRLKVSSLIRLFKVQKSARKGDLYLQRIKICLVFRGQWGL